MKPNPIVLVLYVDHCKGKNNNFIIAIVCDSNEYNMLEIFKFSVSSVDDNQPYAGFGPKMFHERKAYVAALKLLQFTIPRAFGALQTVRSLWIESVQLLE